MVTKYNKKTDLLYIHFATGIANIQVQTDFEEIGKFVSKKDKNFVIGYEIEDASQNLNKFLENFPLNTKQKFAVILTYYRGQQGKTQKEFANILAISESTYKALENSEHNITFDVIDRIRTTLKGEPRLGEIFRTA